LIEKRILSNGITLMTEYLPYVQSVAVGVWALAGSVDESPVAPEAGQGKGSPAGISHLIEHMLFKGTKLRSARDIAEEADRMGGMMNAFTGKETTCYYIKTLSEHLGESISLLGDIFLNSAFEEEELAREKRVVFEEMNMIEDTPEDLGHDILDELIFAGSPLGNRIIGCKDTVGGVTPEAMREYMSKRYVGGNVLISIAGNFTIGEAVELVESVFGSASSGRAVRGHSSVAHVPSFATRAKDIEQSHIFIGRRGVNLTSEDYYAFVLFNNILGGGMSSRLFQNIREEKGLAYSVYSTSGAFVDDGVFIIYAGVSEGGERLAMEAIREELERFAAEGVGVDELLKVKEQSKGAYVFGRENVQTRMFATGKNELLLGKVFGPDEVTSGIDGVTAEDISRIARKCSDISEYSAVVVGKREFSKDEVGL
jgi:predicted Zn-dependent peptidase